MQISRWLRGILAGVILVFSITGCTKEAMSREIVFTTGLTSSEVFKIGGLPCTVGEAKLLLVNVKNQYEAAFGEEIWEQEIEGKNFQIYVKDIVKNQLAQLKCMVLLAEEKGISLTVEEEELVKKAAEIYNRSLDNKEKELLGITIEEIQGVYTNLAIAEKLYQSLTQDVEEEISDAEAKVIVIWHIYKDCTGLSEKEKKEKRRELLNLRDQLLAQEADFAFLAEEYSDDKRLEYSFGRGEMEQSLEEAAFSLASGEISGIVETRNGYHIIKCIDDYDEEKTGLNKVELLKKRKQEAFDQEYAVFIKGVLSEFNEKVWKNITFEELEGIHNKNLYEVYESVMEERKR